MINKKNEMKMQIVNNIILNLCQNSEKKKIDINKPFFFESFHKKDINTIANGIISYQSQDKSLVKFFPFQYIIYRGDSIEIMFTDHVKKCFNEYNEKYKKRLIK